jgi:hypothetical protein
MSALCLNCREEFESLQAYHRHQWNAHAGELDRGEAWT